MRGRSLNVQGRTSSEPRSALAHSPGRMPGERITGGALSFGDFSLHKQRKVTRSPAGRVKALHFKRKELDSGLRRSDDQEKRSASEGSTPCAG